MMRKSILFCLKCYRCMSYFKFEMLIWYDVWFCDDDETVPRVSGMSCKIIKNFVWWKESQPVWRMLITIAFSEFFLSYLKKRVKGKRLSIPVYLLRGWSFIRFFENLFRDNLWMVLREAYYLYIYLTLNIIIFYFRNNCRTMTPGGWYLCVFVTTFLYFYIYAVNYMRPVG